MGERNQKNAFVKAARRAVRKVGWDPRADLEILESERPQALGSPRYGYRPGRVRLTYSPDLPERLARIETAPACRAPSKPGARLEVVVASRVYMSAGSYKICPYSAYDYAGILEAAADGLRSARASEAEVAEFAQPVASFFIASVVAGVSAVAGPDPGAFRSGWPLDQMVSVLEDATLPSYSALYANVQLRLWSDDPALAGSLRSRFPQPFDALEFETDRGVAILLDTFDLAGTGKDGLAWHEEGPRELVIDQLKYNWRHWPIKAFQFAELLAPYVTQPGVDQPNPPQPRTEGGGHAERPSSQAEGRRAAVQGSEMPIRQALEEREADAACALPGMPVEPFAERFNEDARFRRQVLGSGIGTGLNPLKYHMGFESLDALYRHRATRVELESETVHRQGMAFDVAHMTREKLGDGLPSLNRIDWGATRVGAGGELELFQKTLPITDETPAAIRMRGFPDLLFVVDSSGSMGWDPKEGNGPYDALLRAVYSVLAFLEEEKKAQHMRFAAVNFSGTTLCTTWKSFAELKDVKKLLFQYQGGGTVLAPAALQEIARSSSDHFLCLMVTDGKIKNVAAVVGVVQGMLSRGHRFILIQIGAETPLVGLLRQIGVPAHVIPDHQALEGLCLEYTRTVWGPGGAT